MARPDPKEPGTGQAQLFETETVAPRRAGQVLRGRHSKAMDRAITAARDSGEVTDLDEGLTTVLRAGAWALDSMETSGHHYGPAKLVPAITEALRDAHMTPESRAAGDSTDAAIEQLIHDLNKIDDDDAALPHAAD